MPQDSFHSTTDYGHQSCFEHLGGAAGHRPGIQVNNSPVKKLWYFTFRCCVVTTQVIQSLWYWYGWNPQVIINTLVQVWCLYIVYFTSVFHFSSQEMVQTLWISMWRWLCKIFCNTSRTTQPINTELVSACCLWPMNSIYLMYCNIAISIFSILRHHQYCYHLLYTPKSTINIKLFTSRLLIYNPGQC